MSGVALGSQSCLYSDAIFMVSAGTGVSDTRQFEVILPYTIIEAAFAAILFLVVGRKLLKPSGEQSPPSGFHQFSGSAE